MKNEEVEEEAYYNYINKAPKISKRKYIIDSGNNQQSSILSMYNNIKKTQETIEEISAPSCEILNTNIKNKQYLCNFILECSSDVEK